MSRLALKPIKLAMEATSSIHQNLSHGYFETTPTGEKFYVPYTRQEIGEMHSFISPRINTYKHMKWTKTHRWLDRKKAKASKWKYHPTFGGLNTAPK